MEFKLSPYENKIIDKIIRKLAEARKTATVEKPYVIGISGGSCTGKTTYVSKKILDYLGEDALLITQDEFQLGYDLPNYKKSKYRWDDPNNYDEPGLLDVITSLKNGKPTSLPVFDLAANVRTGKGAAEPKPFIVVEGLYTFYRELEPEVDMKIYVETPYYGRFFRRVLRNTIHYGMNPDTPIKHMIDSVYHAHQDHVAKQRANADFVITIPYIFEETINNFKLVPIHNTVPAEVISTITLEAGLELKIVHKTKQYYLQIWYEGTLYYEVKIKKTYISKIQKLDFSCT